MTTAPSQFYNQLPTTLYGKGGKGRVSPPKQQHLPCAKLLILSSQPGTGQSESSNRAPCNHCTNLFHCLEVRLKPSHLSRGGGGGGKINRRECDTWTNTLLPQLPLSGLYPLTQARNQLRFTSELFHPSPV